MFDRRGEALCFRNITVVPSIHGRAAFALEVRRRFLAEAFDCVAVELPPSLEEAALEASAALPEVRCVVYREPGDSWVYVPMDPCDSIVEAIRLASRDRRCALEFIDAEVGELSVEAPVLPDEYAALKIGIPAYYAAVAPHIPRAEAESQDWVREVVMASRLRKLAARHKRVLFVCGLSHVANIGELLAGPEIEPPHPGIPPFDIRSIRVHHSSLVHILGELPHHSWLYEKIRHSITLEEYEPIFGLKDLLLEARQQYHDEFRDEIHRISPQDIQTTLTYIRNLCLMGRYLTPSLYDIALAAKGVGGDAFAIRLLELARHYGDASELVERRRRALEADDDGDESDEGDESEGDEDQEPGGGFDIFSDEESDDDDVLKMTEDRGMLKGNVEAMKRRLPSAKKQWRRLKLERSPTRRMRKEWRRAWDDRSAVSWPAEDEIVEGFADYVRKRALSMTQISMVRAEEFSSSLMDGLHLRETMRNFHLNKLYVKVEPRVTGNVGAVVIIFEEDGEDEDRFPWKITWYAEHDNESTLAFYATPYQDNIVGPGIARSLYGGALFIYPPKPMPDIWSDPGLDHAKTSMERLVFGAAVHAEDRYVAYVSPTRPTKRMREFCSLRGRKLIYLPLSSFSRGTLWKLRTFHVLNGRHVRSYAARYIR